MGTRNFAFVAGLALVCLAVSGRAVLAGDADGTWISNANANWWDSTRWAGGVIANGVDKTADFSTIDITAARTVTVDAGGRTIGHLKFGDTTPSNDWTLSGGTLTLDVTTGTPVIDVINRTATISCVLAGNDGLTKAGLGTLTLSAVNTYSGGTTVNAGTLTLGIANALPTDGAVTVNGSTLNFAGLTHTNAIGTLTLAGGTLSGTGTLTLGANVTSSGTSTISGGTLALGAASRTFTVTADTLTVSSIVSGTGVGITKEGAGTLTLSGSNTYTGGVTLNAGTLFVGHNNALGSSAGGGPVTIKGGTTIGVPGASGYSSSPAGGFSLQGSFSTGGGAGTLTLGSASSVFTMTQSLTITTAANTTLDLAGPIGDGGGAYKLTKEGAGTLRLSRSSTFTGGIDINAGTLRVAAVTFSAGGVVYLPSTGTLQLDSAGTATISGQLTLDGGAIRYSSTGNTGTLSVGTLHATPGSETRLATNASQSLTLSAPNFSGSGSIRITNDLTNTPKSVGITGGGTSNTYTGTVYVDYGGLDPAATTLTNATVYMNPGTTLDTNTSPIIGTLYLNGASMSSGGGRTVTATVVVTGDSTANIAGGSSIALRGTLQGSANITVNAYAAMGATFGPASAGLDSSNYFGAIRFTSTGGGTADLGLPSAVDFQAGGLISTGGIGRVTNTSRTTRTLTLKPQAGQSYMFTGMVTDGTTDSFTALKIDGTPTGTQVLTNPSSTYKGGTTVSGGTLLIGADVPVSGNSPVGTGSVTVNGGKLALDTGVTMFRSFTFTSGKIGGNGTFAQSGGVTVPVGAYLDPGMSVGATTFATGLTVNGIYTWELGALSTSNPGVDYDIAYVTGGNLTVGGSSALTIVFGSTPDPTSGNDFWKENRSWMIIDFSGAGTSTGNFASITGGGVYSTGKFQTVRSGDDILLQWLSAPVAEAGGPYTCSYGATVGLSGSVLPNTGTPPFTYDWDLKAPFQDPYDILNTQNPSVAYGDLLNLGLLPGQNNTIQLRVKDGNNLFGYDTATLYLYPLQIPVVDAKTGLGLNEYVCPFMGSIQFTGSVSGGMAPFTFEWDLDNDGQYDDALGATTLPWSYSELIALGITPGVPVQIGLRVTDLYGAQGFDTGTLLLLAPVLPIAEPAGLSLIGLALLGLKRRRRS